MRRTWPSRCLREGTTRIPSPIPCDRLAFRHARPGINADPTDVCSPGGLKGPGRRRRRREGVAAFSKGFSEAVGSSSDLSLLGSV